MQLKMQYLSLKHQQYALISIDSYIVYSPQLTPVSFISLLSNFSEAMKTMTEKYDKTAAQIFFKFLNTQNIIPLSGTKDQTHMIQV